MEIREPRSKAGPALGWSAEGYSAAAKSLQSLAEDISAISAANFERNAKLIDDLRNARSVEDLVGIQTKFMANLFEAFNDHVRLMGARMAEMRNDIADAGAPAAAFDEAARETPPDQAAQAAATAMQANLTAGQEIARSVFEAGEKTADAMQHTVREAFSTEPPQAPAGATGD